MKGMAVQGMTVQGAAPKAPNVPKVPGAPARVLAPPKKEEEEEENDDESGDDQQAALIASTRARLSKVKTAAKQAASRENGKKGGRPPKAQVAQ